MFILGVTFVEILKNEWLGIIASAFVLVSFLFSKQTITRLINICGCIAFVIYGILLPAYSTAFMNAALIVVHVVFLVKDYLAKKRQSARNRIPSGRKATATRPTLRKTNKRLDVRGGPECFRSASPYGKYLCPIPK